MTNPESISLEWMRAHVPPRPADLHKWSIGGVLVIAGSPAYPGAAILASRSAGRNGAGIVILAGTRSLIATTTAAMPDVAHVVIPETESASSARIAMERLGDMLGRVHAVVVGPGLGDDDATAHLMAALFGFAGQEDWSRWTIGFGGESRPGSAPAAKGVFDQCDHQIVVDADALNWLANQDQWWERVPAHRLVLTPHVGEMARLTGKDTSEILADPAGIAQEFTQRWSQTVVVKCDHSVVSDGARVIGGDAVSPALAKAGSGDTLAGAIGAWLAQGAEPAIAAGLALGIGNHAAQALTQDWGERGVVSSDLADAMAKSAYQVFEAKRSEQ